MRRVQIGATDSYPSTSDDLRDWDFTWSWLASRMVRPWVHEHTTVNYGYRDTVYNDIVAFTIRNYEIDHFLNRSDSSVYCDFVKILVFGLRGIIIQKVYSMQNTGLSWCIRLIFKVSSYFILLA